MKMFLRCGVVIVLALAISMPAQAETDVERLDALEARMANVELLTTQLFTLFSAMQTDIVSILLKSK